MAALEDEIKSLKEKNTELVQKVQYWKMTAAQRENEKLELMKEINELRLKVIRLKSSSAAEARKLDAALQTASEQALSHLVQASNAVTRTIELAKTYMRDREGKEIVSPRWSNISNSNEKVHRVPPMMGGQSIQPVVSLSRAMLNINTSRQTARSPNSTRNVTVRALPMHMLQDVYIPLTRIDMRDIPTHNETEQEAANDSGDNVPFDTSMEEATEEPQNMTDDDDFESSRRLDIVTEDAEPESEEQTPPRARVDNPLEGPSWLLDAPRRAALEPDSTTEEAAPPTNSDSPEPVPEAVRVFTPTVRRRKRSRTPPPLPPPEVATDALNGSLSCSRVLQVLVPKLLVSEVLSPAPSKRRAPRFDAPSPNGATDSRVIVSEELESQARERPPNQSGSGEPDQANQTPVGKRDRSRTRDPQESYSRDQERHESYREELESQARERPPNQSGSGEPDQANQTPVGKRDRSKTRDPQESYSRDRERLESYRLRDSGDSDSGSGADRVSEGRTRRNRKPVTYKEKPLNRKLRR